jgi:hypothetical protein
LLRPYDVIWLMPANNDSLLNKCNHSVQIKSKRPPESQ